MGKSWMAFMQKSDWNRILPSLQESWKIIVILSFRAPQRNASEWSQRRQSCQPPTLPCRRRRPLALPRRRSKTSWNRYGTVNIQREKVKINVVMTELLCIWRELRDQRVDSWPLMNSPLPTMAICCLYFYCVKFAGPRFMATGEATGHRQTKQG